jgi:hypothetical protein
MVHSHVWKVKGGGNAKKLVFKSANHIRLRIDHLYPENISSPDLRPDPPSTVGLTCVLAAITNYLT